MMIKRPTPFDYIKVASGSDNVAFIHLRLPDIYAGRDKTIVDAAPKGAECMLISGNVVIYRCGLDKLKELEMALYKLIQGWIKDDSVCGDTCKATRNIATRAPFPVACADCDRVYGPEGFIFRKWEKI